MADTAQIWKFPLQPDVSKVDMPRGAKPLHAGCQGWQVTLDHEDEVHVREFWGNRIEEIRVHNHIPKSRLWLVGSRAVPTRGGRRG